MKTIPADIPPMCRPEVSTLVERSAQGAVNLVMKQVIQSSSHGFFESALHVRTLFHIG
jgi:hypothetical protein